MPTPSPVQGPTRHQLGPPQASRSRARRGLLAALAIAVLAGVVVVERHTLATSLHVLANLNLAWFLLAVAAR